MQQYLWSIYGMFMFYSKFKASPRLSVSVILVQLNFSVVKKFVDVKTAALSFQTYPPVAV